MTAFSRVSAFGWEQGDDSATLSRLVAYGQRGGWRSQAGSGAALAGDAIAGALASGLLNVNAPLTGAAIAGALGSATLLNFPRVWRIQTSAPNGTSVYAAVLAGTRPNYSLVAQGNAVVAGGFVDISGSGTPGTKAGAVVGNWDDDTDSVSIFGGWAIGTIVDL